MSSFFGKLKSGNEAKGSQSGSTPSKKDPNAPQPTPLERMLQNAGPIRNDGSDKFFGLENFGNTCYCNSILQCLYYTPPFRDQILAYPSRSTVDSINRAAVHAPPRNRTIPQTKATIQTVTPGGPPKPEDKDSPEYKKKVALAAGPVVNMGYQNSGSYDMEESLYSSLKDLFEAIVIHSNRYGVVSPTRFLEVLRKENEMFRSAMHQDAHEFFNLVLNSIMDTIENHEKKIVATKPEEKQPAVSVEKADNSTVSWPTVLPVPEAQSGTKWLRDMFEGTMSSETRCLTCETVSQRDEAFLDLSVDLEQHSSVTSCLNRFSEEEMLCERNKFHCDNCGGLQEAEKRMKIKKLPEVLALHLKRFKYTEDLQRLQKLHHKVVYPYHLRLFNTTDDAEDPDRLYELYAVVIHIGGGPYHGHYVSIIKTQDRGWLLFDDEMVEPVDQSFVRNFFGDKQGMASAYVLFYRHTTLEEVRKEQKMEGKRRVSQTLTNGLKVVTKDSSELHRIQSASPPLSPLQTSGWTNLDHAITAPPMAPNGHVEPPRAGAPVMVSPNSPTTQNKKDKAKEEKDRKAAEKAAEKEREKADKARRKDLEQRLKDAHKKQADDLKTALEASKNTKADEDQKNGAAEASSLQTNGISSKDIFRRSKSFKFGSLGRKDRAALGDESTNGSSAISEESPIEAKDEEKDINKRKNRFSLRKKSFNVL